MLAIIFIIIFYIMYFSHVEDVTSCAGGFFFPVFRDNEQKIQWGKMIEHYLIRLPFMLFLILLALLFGVAL